ncbi:hypothetical protein THAOC_26897 [Thalassiosira oceanica]|uniref:Uncharacterized protein n=1 Tax=Thalassiosira oceanica TaxID=159749 RepID=K0RK95_THAOC|nr:hypothetical protein THAOC_26897 [Thalassiosira oceanica]|eukprot:EJK53625.1 hypothetical protein THAOC_26897 [Thalassiosira oceanica]
MSCGKLKSLVQQSPRCHLQYIPRPCSDSGDSTFARCSAFRFPHHRKQEPGQKAGHPIQDQTLIRQKAERERGERKPSSMPRTVKERASVNIIRCSATETSPRRSAQIEKQRSPGNTSNAEEAGVRTLDEPHLSSNTAQWKIQRNFMGGKPHPGKVRHFHVQGGGSGLYDRHVRGGRGPGVEAGPWPWKRTITGKWYPSSLGNGSRYLGRYRRDKGRAVWKTLSVHESKAREIGRVEETEIMGSGVEDRRTIELDLKCSPDHDGATPGARN